MRNKENRRDLVPCEAIRVQERRCGSWPKKPRRRPSWTKQLDLLKQIRPERTEMHDSRRRHEGDIPRALSGTNAEMRAQQCGPLKRRVPTNLQQRRDAARDDQGKVSTLPRSERRATHQVRTASRTATKGRLDTHLATERRARPLRKETGSRREQTPKGKTPWTAPRWKRLGKRQRQACSAEAQKATGTKTGAADQTAQNVRRRRAQAEQAAFNRKHANPGC